MKLMIKHTEFLAEHSIKNEIRQLLSKYNHGKQKNKHQKQ